MTIYIILLLYWGFFALILNQLFKNRIKSKNKIYIIMAGGSLFLLMSLRHISVGTDLISYYSEYLNSELYLTLRPSELGYSYFNYFFSNIGMNFQLYLSVIALITVGSISKLYLKFSQNIMLSYYLFVTLGLFGMTLTGLRQSLAIIITIFAFISLMENKKLLFFILVFVASLFHNSAISFLIVYLLKNIKLTRKKGFIIYFITLASYFGLDIFILVVEKLSPEQYLRKYMFLESNINPLVILVYLLIPLAVLLVWKPTSKDKHFDSPMSAMFMISLMNILIYFLATEVALFERISFYFIIYNTILIPNAIETIRSRDIKLISKIACIVFPLIMFLISTPGGSLGIDNYKFFWE